MTKYDGVAPDPNATQATITKNKLTGVCAQGFTGLTQKRCVDRVDPKASTEKMQEDNAKFIHERTDKSTFLAKRQLQLYSCCDYAIKFGLLITAVGFTSHFLLQKPGSPFVRASYVFLLSLSVFLIKLLVKKY